MAEEAEEEGDYVAADALRARARKLRAVAQAGAVVVYLASRRKAE
jgi:hypothetical protein